MSILLLVTLVFLWFLGCFNTVKNLNCFYVSLAAEPMSLCKRDVKKGVVKTILKLNSLSYASIKLKLLLRFLN